MQEPVAQVGPALERIGAGLDAADEHALHGRQQQHVPDDRGRHGRDGRAHAPQWAADDERVPDQRDRRGTREHQEVAHRINQCGVQRAIEGGAPTRGRAICRHGHRHLGRRGRESAATFAPAQMRAVDQRRHVVESGTRTHRGVEPEAGVGADEAVGPDVDPADAEHAVLDAKAQDMRLGADAGALADGDEVERRAEDRRDRRVAADLGAHRAIVEAHQRRADEHVRPAEALEAVHQPPAEVIEAPHRILARPVAPDHQPLEADAQCQQDRPVGERQTGCEPQRGVELHAAAHDARGHEHRVGERRCDDAVVRHHRDRLQHDAGPALPGRHGGKGLLGRGRVRRCIGGGRRVRGDAQLLQARRHCPDRSEFVEIAHRDPGRAEPRPQLRDDARRQQRMAAQVQEEVVLDRHRRHLQALLPGLHHDALDIALRGHHVPARALEQVERCRQLLAVDLAAGEHGEMLDDVEVLRDHVVGKHRSAASPPHPPGRAAYPLRRAPRRPPAPADLRRTPCARPRP